MSIRSNIGTGVVNVKVSDTILFSPSTDIDRYQVGACNVYNTTAFNIGLRVYVSPNTTSVSGNLVETIEVRAGEEVDISSIIGQGYNGYSIIVVAFPIGAASAIGLNASLTRTEYDNGS